MVKKIAIIDDDKFWVNWIRSKITEHNFDICEFDDLRKFLLTENLADYNTIICDYLFIGYDVEDTNIETEFKKNKFKGTFYLITHSPREIKNENLFTRVFDKGAIKRNKNFTFDKYI